MHITRDCIAIVVSAPGLDKPSIEQARLARQLAETKVAAAQDIVSDSRYGDAQRMLKIGMRVLFHQGGAPSIWEGKVLNVGRLIAAGCLAGIGLLDNANPAPNTGLLSITRRMFLNKNLQGFLWFLKVEPIKNPVLTKYVLGRPPRPWENYIVICPGDSSFEPLLGTWQSAY